MEFLARQPTTMWCRNDSGLQMTLLKPGYRDLARQPAPTFDCERC